MNKSTGAHIVCYSGGEASAIVAIEVVRRYGPENVILINHDINGDKEDVDIKRFKREVAGYLGIPITYANMDGWETKDQFDVCIEAKAFKVGVHPLCTNRLKTAPFHRWLADTFPVEAGTCRTDVTIYYGFEAGEPARIERRRGILGDKGYRTCFPLAEWTRTIASTTDIGISPPATYAIWKHANCVGCLRAGQQHWYVVYCRRRDAFEKAKRAEELIGYSILRINGQPAFMKDLEPKFEAMRAAGIQADEKTPAATFWARARKLLGSKPAEEAAACGVFQLTAP
ncbi:hypothetical protein [Cohnella sp. GbtcB17]|uniref:hypothetical protein n=1 Tax=Cohnella sp. GbtcB17 TaxID=2824762 RepID=UPI001C3030F1|nr:hypothetical protein [Cohnella sp. GbtcB17]